MTLKTAAAAIACSAAAVGCNVHLVDREAWACLDSERLNFRNPDSVELVQVLGKSQDGTIWIRYKGQNGFGGYSQENMACHEVGGKVVRNHAAEEIAVQRVIGESLDQTIASLKAGSKAHGGVSREEARAIVMRMTTVPPN